MPTSAAAIYFLFGCVFYYIYEGNIVCESARAKNESRSSTALCHFLSQTYTLELSAGANLKAAVTRLATFFQYLCSGAYFTSNLGISLVCISHVVI